MTIAYAIEPSLSVEEFIDVLRRSTLAERRPVDDHPRIAKMLKHAGLIVTARDGLGEQATFLLLSAPGAMTYYPQAGLSPFGNCFGLRGPWPKSVERPS